MYWIVPLNWLPDAVAVGGRDFRAGCGVDLLDDDRELVAFAARFVIEQRAVDLAEDRVRGQEHPRLEGLEQELAVGGRPSVAGAACLGRVRRYDFAVLQPALQKLPLTHPGARAGPSADSGSFSCAHARLQRAFFLTRSSNRGPGRMSICSRLPSQLKLLLH